MEFSLNTCSKTKKPTATATFHKGELHACWNFSPHSSYIYFFFLSLNHNFNLSNTWVCEQIPAIILSAGEVNGNHQMFSFFVFQFFGSPSRKLSWIHRHFKYLSKMDTSPMRLMSRQLANTFEAIWLIFYISMPFHTTSNVFSIFRQQEYTR